MLKHVLRSLLLIAFPSTAGGWRSGVEEHPEQLAAHSPAVYLLLVALPWFLIFDLSGLRAGFLQLIGIMNLFHATLPT